MIFKVIEEQICIGVNKMDCDTYGEISNEMKSMLFTVEGRALTLRFVMLSIRSLSRSPELYSARWSKLVMCCTHVLTGMCMSDHVVGCSLVSLQF